MLASHLRAPTARPAAPRALGTIFSQGEPAAPGWYAALGIPLEGARACPFWVVSRPAPPTPPARPPRPGTSEPTPGGERGVRAARGSPAWRRASPPPRRCLLWPVCVCVTAGRETGRRRRARQRERSGTGARARDPSASGKRERHRGRDRARRVRETARERHTE